MSQERRGTVLGVAAYLAWGLFPLYWPLLEPAGSVEILAHRVVWSLAFVVVLLLLAAPVARRRMRRTLRASADPPAHGADRRSAVRRLPRDRRALSLLAIASVFIALNWGLYIWGVNHQHVVETSLGYFVNPLVTVALGVLVLSERLRRLQWVAVGIAAIGVVVLTVNAGQPPWIALTLAFSFGTYGLVKKVVGVGALEGLLVETALLAPAAIAYLVVIGAEGSGTFTTGGADHTLLLAGAGPVTALPLLAFAGAAALVPLSRLGLMQYLTPTMQFLIGVLVRHEPLGTGRLVGFSLVWIALAMFTVDTASHRRPELAVAAEASAA